LLGFPHQQVDKVLSCFPFERAMSSKLGFVAGRVGPAAAALCAAKGHAAFPAKVNAILLSQFL
jgi:hypothetical protein